MLATGPAGVRPDYEVPIMRKLFDETNALTDAEGLALNMYFVKPVDKKVSCLTWARQVDTSSEARLAIADERY